MNHIQRQVRFAQRRMNIQTFAAWLPWSLAATWFVGLIAIALPKLVDLGSHDYVANSTTWMGIWLGGGTVLAVVLAGAASFIRRASSFQSAMEIDRRAGLDERTATAISLEKSNDLKGPAGQIVIEDANRRLDGIDLSKLFNVRFARTSPLSLLILLSGLLIGWVVPNAKTSETPVLDPTEVVNREQLEETSEDLKEKLLEQLKIAEEAGLEEAAELFKALEKQASELDSDREMSKKEALVKLNDLQDQLESRVKELGDAKQMQQTFAKLDDIKEGPADKLVQAMKDGNFEKANEQLSELAEQLGDEALSPEQKQAMKEQLEELAEKLSEMANQQQQQEEALEQRIAEAQRQGDLEKAAELQEQLEQMQKQQGNSSQQLQDLAQMLQNASESLNSELGDPQNMQQAQQGLQDLAQSLEGLQKQMDELESLEGVLSQVGECKGQLSSQPGSQSGSQPGGQGQSQGQGLAQSGQGKGQGQGSGQGEGDGLGEGQGFGERPENATETGTFESKVDGTPQQGEVVISGKINGPNKNGVSRAEIQQSIQSARQSDVDPVGEQQLPRSKRDQVKEYFEKFRKRGN
ncbi:MAG: hypothetical protein VXX11_08405 [Planctomycetota bacterium]|nr:hypothetical protein [Planctomycetota bacterium]